MKSTGVLIALFLLSFTAFAQLEKGNFLLGGDINFNNDRDKPNGINKETNTVFGFSPSAGYFISSKFVIGLEFAYNNTKGKTENTSSSPIVNTQTDRSVTIGPFVRYYKSIGDKLALFGQGSLGYLHTTNIQNQEGLVPNYNYKNKGDGFYANVKPGMAYFITQKFGLELTFGSLGYKSSSVKSDVVSDKATNNGFNFNFGFNSLTLGARFYL